jgi:nitroreductase
MDALDCIRGRMSIRAFRDEEVPKEKLRELVEIARWSPSYKNSQPWEVMIVSGEKKKALSGLMIELMEKGAPASPDIPAPQTWPGAEQDRIDHLYAMRKEATGIDLSDPAIVKKARKANFRFYNAPHAVYLFQDASLSPWSIFDMGAFAQNLMLAAHAMGIGTVPQAFVTDYAREIKEFLGISGKKRLILGISLGFPDMDSPANKLRTDRAPVDDLVTFLK